MIRQVILLLLAAIVAAGVSCDRPRQSSHVNGGSRPRPGVSEVEPGAAPLPTAAGQTIFVPAYSSVSTADNSRLYPLAITLSIRNTDRNHPIVIVLTRYYDQDGRLVRSFVEKPLRLAPMASLDVFVRESDTSGGTSASFLVEWVADQAVSDPCVEAVMIGTTGNQGISFTSQGRVVADRARPSE